MSDYNGFCFKQLNFGVACYVSDNLHRARTLKLFLLLPLHLQSTLNKAMLFGFYVSLEVYTYFYPFITILVRFGEGVKVHVSSTPFNWKLNSLLSLQSSRHL